MADRPYVRVYYEIVDDEKFANVYSDDRSLATWLRLLLSADASYPSSAPVPRWVLQKTLTTLESAGLIRVHGHHYTIVGLAAERERRRAGALSGGLARGKQLRNARLAAADRGVSLARAGASRGRASPRLGSAIEGGPGGGDDDVTVALAHVAKTRGAVDPGGKAGMDLARMVDRHGVAAVIAAVDGLPPSVREGRAVVYSAMNVLDPIHRSPNGTKAKGMGPNIEEVERAFRTK